MNSAPTSVLGSSFSLPCGLMLRNRIVKAAMSDSMGDGTGRPTDEQVRLYERWEEGGAALSIIGEVQIGPGHPEKPGNLVLDASADEAAMRRLAASASSGGRLWPQLGHAGAMSFPPISEPVGPSALDLPGVRCTALSLDEVRELPARFARSAALAKAFGFSGVELHAAHGFLLSQFLSPLFNRRTDAYGGSIEKRGRLVTEVLEAVRSEVGSAFAVGVKINATDELEGGFTEADSLAVIGRLGAAGADLIDISGGTYFPGAASASDRVSSGAYYADVSRRARDVTDVPLMLTGGIKTRAEAERLVESGTADLVGLARTMVLDPWLPQSWTTGSGSDPTFPRFDDPPPGGVTAWFTMQFDSIAAGGSPSNEWTAASALREYEARDAERVVRWNARHRGRPSTADRR